MPPEARLRIGWVCEAEAVLGEGVADPRRRRLAALRRRAAARSGRWKSAIRSRPSSLARYIAWSAATRTASEPPPRSPPNIVIPTLIVAASASAPAGALSATWARRSSPSCIAPAMSVCGISTANSSPERRATMSVARTRSRMIAGDLADQVVAGVVAELSLTALRPSMSMIITAPWPP